MKAVIATAFAFALISSSAQADELIVLPSGQTVTFHEQLQEQDGALVRLRFIAPALASPLKRPSFEDMTADLETLCTEYGLPKFAKEAANPTQIIISLSAELVEFGLSNSGVQQVFEAFSVENETCMLEMF